jgi:sugar lactone lactonase YvrE
VTELRIADLRFPEGPRWRDGTWWLSDQLGDRILRVGPDGAAAVVAEVHAPSGLGFLADGVLVAALMHEPSLVRAVGGTVEEIVDLRGVAGHLNDMFVDAAGRAYVDAYDDFNDQSTHRLLLVTPGADPVVATAGLAFPNGVAITVDGATLVLSETFAGRISAFDVATDGSLSGRRVWAQLPDGVNPDGLCLDERGDVWVASYLSGEFLHVREGGEILDRFGFTDRWALSCSIGGDDGRTLLLCTSETTQRDYFAGRAVGHLETRRVDVPGVGRP